MKPKKKLTRQGVQYFDEGGQVVRPMQTMPMTLPNQNTVAGANGEEAFQTASTPFVTMDPNKAFQAVGGLAQSMASAFTPQSGYVAQLAPTQQMDYSGLINQAAGNSLAQYQPYMQNIAAQQQLASALMANANGQGVNPAQALLANQTAQNTANQAALMAGQRGASSNAGLIARQAAQQGAANQQNAIGQAASLGAQQQLAAQNALTGLYGNIGNQIQGQQGASNQLFGLGTGAINAQNQNLVENYRMAQGLNQNTSLNNAAALQKTTGGLLNGAGSALSMFGLAKGGEVPNPKLAKVPLKDRMSRQFYPDHLEKMANIYHAKAMYEGGIAETGMDVMSDPSPQMVKNASPAESGGAFKNMASGAKGLGSGVNKSINEKTELIKPVMYDDGGKVPGKAKVSGDSYKNDTVPAMLSPGEIVIPREIAQGPDAPQRAAEFVAKQLQKHGHGGEGDDFRSALKKAMMNRKKA